MSSNNTNDLLHKALQGQDLSVAEGEYLFEHAATAELMYVGNSLRQAQKRDTNGIVTWQIDRNVNTTNVCVANCKFLQLLCAAKHQICRPRLYYGFGNI
jgi:cyclic dehypoxanthinyl futalosine synthase